MCYPFGGFEAPVPSCSVLVLYCALASCIACSLVWLSPDLCVSLFQIKNKFPQLPVFEPDSSEPIFGNNEDELVGEKREREQNYMKHQLEAAASRKRKAILSQLVDQKRDLRMLQKTQKE